jgi:hypothetical protein
MTFATGPALRMFALLGSTQYVRNGKANSVMRQLLTSSEKTSGSLAWSLESIMNVQSKTSHSTQVLWRGKSLPRPEAARCAGEQRNYWKVREELLLHPEELDPPAKTGKELTGNMIEGA